MSKKRILLIVAMLFAFTLSIGVTAAQDVSELTIWWAQWSPADYLQQIGNDYEAATGIKVNVVQTPWGDFYTRVGTEWAAKGTSYDLIVGDSQWVGQGVTQGHYVDMTDFMVSNGLDKTVTAATLRYYGEYPQGSGNYYAYPTEGDANGWAYRKDLFENPDEQAAFMAKYGYELAVPETWDQLRDIAEFFTRPDDGSIWRGYLYPGRLRRDHNGLRKCNVQLRRKLAGCRQQCAGCGELAGSGGRT